MSDGNFKVRALKTDSDFFYEGDIIEFVDGSTVWVYGGSSSYYKDFTKFMYDNPRWADYLEEIKEGEKIMESTKGNFKVKCLDLRELIEPCLFVRIRGENAPCIAIKETSDIGFYSTENYRGISSLSSYDKNLNNSSDNDEYDIIEIMDFTDYSSILKCGKTIWKREEAPIKSPTQLEIESIESEQRKLADRLSELRKGL